METLKTMRQTAGLFQSCMCGLASNQALWELDKLCVGTLLECHIVNPTLPLHLVGIVEERSLLNRGQLVQGGYA